MAASLTSNRTWRRDQEIMRLEQGVKARLVLHDPGRVDQVSCVFRFKCQGVHAMKIMCGIKRAGARDAGLAEIKTGIARRGPQGGEQFHKPSAGTADINDTFDALMRSVSTSGFRCRRNPPRFFRRSGRRCHPGSSADSADRGPGLSWGHRDVVGINPRQRQRHVAAKDLRRAAPE